jgi:hypothetical protein
MIAAIEGALAESKFSRTLEARSSDPKAFLTELFRLAIEVADPARVKPAHLP